jgi:hypothetical protein
LAIFISIGLIYLASLNEKDKHTEISQGTAPTVDSTSRKQDTVTLIKNIAEKSFAKFYKPYSGEKDPVEISNYYNDYKQHNYDAVIKAKESDYQTMGTGDKNEILKQYMHLYKGLSWLELNEPETALEQFAAISKSSLEDRRPYYESQWYSVLAWLKGNDITKAREQAKEIIKTKSPHNFDAEKFLRQY